MKNCTLNLFKLTNWATIDFSYKLVDFNLPIVEGAEDRFNKQLQKIAREVASLTGGPTAIVKRNGRSYVAVPSDKELCDTTINVVPYNVKISLLQEVHTVNAKTLDSSNSDVVVKFLDFTIRKQLSKNNGLWKLNASQFFSKEPVNGRNGSEIQIYEGFTYKLVRLQNGELYICLDLSTKYIDKHVHSHHVNAKNVNAIGKSFRGRKFVYLNGENWYAVELVGHAGVIGTHEIDDMNGKSTTVYNYILNNANGRRQQVESKINRNDLTMLYKYPGRTMEPHSGASSLAKMIYSPKDKEVQSLHSFSIKDPTTRFESIEKYIKAYFQNIQFKGTSITVSSTALVEKIPNFGLPHLKFRNNTILNPANAVREYASLRKRLLVTHGVLNSDIFDEQYLLVPESMDRNLVEAIQRNLEYQLKKLATKFQKFKVIRYPVKGNQATTFQIQEIEQTLTRYNALSGFALFILPDLTTESKKYVKTFHDCLKSKFYPDLKVQCASGYKLKSYFEAYPAPDNNALREFRVPAHLQQKFASYLFNLCLEHLNVNRKWPYALAKNLHYDIYIGIDVHDRHAGFSFFLKNGEHIFFFPVKVPLRNKSTRAEKLKAKLIVDNILPQLQQFIRELCPNPNGIIIIRDGRSFGEELKALESVLSQLHNGGLIKKEAMHYGVIDLHKQSSMPLRIGSNTNGHNKLENPIAGAFKVIGDSEAFLYNTGFPFQIRGSAKPLNISLKGGTIDFLKTLEDVFCQSMLAFSSPDRSNSLPITIKLIDLLLEPLSEFNLDMDDDGNEYEELDHEEH
jgi:hypothetical protein